jgi:hypothetical protein
MVVMREILVSVALGIDVVQSCGAGDDSTADRARTGSKRHLAVLAESCRGRQPWASQIHRERDNSRGGRAAYLHASLATTGAPGRSLRQTDCDFGQRVRIRTLM